MRGIGVTTRIRPGWTSLVVVALIWVATAAQGAALDFDRPAVDVIASYTESIFDTDSVPKIYTSETALSPEIPGSARFKNDRDTLLETQMTITFGEGGFINRAGAAPPHRSRGLGSHSKGLHGGDPFYKYRYTDIIALRMLRSSNFTKLIDGDAIVLEWSSKGIRNIVFNRRLRVVPEPSTAMLLGLGLLAMGRRSRRRR
jgi:hypothetical protein